MSNYVYIAASIDGFIARTDGSLDWLLNYENPDHTDYGYKEFIDKIDAVVMGRNTFESVRNMEPWPYEKPVFVLSRSLGPDAGTGKKYQILSAAPRDLVSVMIDRGFKNLYIDGGKTIQGFLQEDLIDELILTRIPVILGAGIPLFGTMDRGIALRHIETVSYQNGFVKSRYVRA